jgi:uncharacterized protein
VLIYIVLTAAGFLAGIFNALAGGGGLIAFPAMLFAGLDPIQANASSFVALFPGGWMSAWAYRRNIRTITEINVRVAIVMSMAGALIGALLLLYTPSSIFAVLVPWLMLFATTLFAIGSFAPLHVTRRMRLGPYSVMVVLFISAIYGGYFGGGIGFLMLSAFTLFGMRDINAMNGLKMVLVGVMAITSIAAFILADVVSWPETVPMTLAALAAGYVGAHGAKHLNQRLLKGFIVAFGALMTGYFFWRGV